MTFPYFNRVKAALILLVCSLFFFPLRAGNPQSDFKIVGYYSLRSAMDGTHKLPFKMLTHINLYFLNPDSLGNFTRDLSPLKKFVDKAHRKNIKVLFSIAGGSEHPYYHKLLRENNRAKFIQDLVSQVIIYNLDGIDVDIEGNDIDENYEAFVTELGQALKQHQKLMTSAIAVYYKDQFSDAALSQYDFVNIMVYDRTGPWSPDKPGQHSSYNDAVEDLHYFGVERNIPKEKMVLGVPFYGYGFGNKITSPVKTMNYNQIVTTFPGAETLDQWEMSDGMIMYYNGMPTITKKTELAMEKASGIMIWQIGGDTKGSKSLLKTINKTAYSAK
jgi:chitinase